MLGPINREKGSRKKEARREGQENKYSSEEGTSLKRRTKLHPQEWKLRNLLLEKEIYRQQGQLYLAEHRGMPKVERFLRLVGESNIQQTHGFEEWEGEIGALLKTSHIGNVSGEYGEDRRVGRRPMSKGKEE